MERLLSSAKELSSKVENNEAAAGELLKQCENLQQQLKAMRQVIEPSMTYIRYKVVCFKAEILASSYSVRGEASYLTSPNLPIRRNVCGGCCMWYM